MDADSELAIIQCHGQFGWFFFSIVEEIKKVEIPDVKLDFPGQKSQSQILRAVLYRKWEKGPNEMPQYSTFEVYYNAMMERIINQIKDTL